MSTTPAFAFTPAPTILGSTDASIPAPASATGGRRKRTRGGSGAAPYSEYVYGNPSQQHAVAGTNVIAAVNDPSKYGSVGGKKRTQKGLIIPTVFLVSNGTRRTRRRRSGKKGGKSAKKRSSSKKGGKSSKK